MNFDFKLPQDIEDLSAEERISLLERSTRFRLRMIYGLFALAVALIAGILVVSNQVDRLETKYSHIDEMSKHLVNMAAKVSQQERQNQLIVRTLNQVNLTDNQSKLEKVIALSASQEEHTQLQLKAYAQSMLRLSRMVQGSREWHEDLKKDWLLLLKNSESIHSDLNQLLSKDQSTQPKKQLANELDLNWKSSKEQQQTAVQLSSY